MYSAIAANKRKTWLIIAAFALLVAGLGWIAGRLVHQPYFTYAALIGAAIWALIQYFAAAKIALAINGAKEISKQDAPRLYRTVENLAISTGMPMPKIYVIDDPAPNAFATGRDPNHAVVAATTGLLDIMSDTELEAVMAHELGHVKNYDIRVMMIVFGLVSAIGFLADILTHFLWFSDDEDRSPVMLIVALVAGLIAPFLAMLIQLAVSRRREYLADSTGVMTTRYPEGLAQALEKIRDHGSAMRRQSTSTAHLFFASPLRGKSLARLFSTHPPIDDRIRRLREMGNHL